MHRINLDGQDEVVKRFVLGLTVDPSGSLLELGGKPVVCVIPPPTAEPNGRSDVWTKSKSDRRSFLIDKKYDSELTPAEDLELNGLQQEFYRHLEEVATLPIEEARALHQRLLAAASQASTSP